MTTLQSHIEEHAPYGVVKMAGGEWVPQPKARNAGTKRYYLTAGQLREAIENCEGCGGSGEAYGNVTEDRMGHFPCATCSPLRRVVGL